jgi:brefeldin A-resistance guanine nucleotide exchange factor 1
LIHSLSSLREKLLQEQSVDVLEIVRPFCDVVTNKETTGPITGAAISALDKFLASGLLGTEYSSSAQGIREIGEAVTHARFVGTNTANDEVVLMTILKVSLL